MSDDTRSVDRLREAFAAREGKPRPEDRAFDDAEVWAASRGELDDERTRELLDLAARDPECAESWRLALAMQRAQKGRPAESETDQVARAGSATGKRRLGWFAAVAAAALAVLLVPLWINDVQREQAPAEFREQVSFEIESLVASDTALPRDGFVLEWSPGPEGTLYAVEIADRDVTILAAARDLAQPRYEVAPEALESVAPGGTVLWRVEAILPDGAQLESPTFRVRVE